MVFERRLRFSLLTANTTTGNTDDLRVRELIQILSPILLLLHIGFNSFIRIWN